VRTLPRDPDLDHETPPAVVGSVAAGTAPLPFLAVYAVLFIVHGGFHHVVPPDVTRTDKGELGVGLVCLVAFLIGAVTELWLLNGRWRWPFVVVQAAFLALAIDFLIDPTKGGRVVSGLVAVAALVALVLAAHPQAWEHVGLGVPRWLGRVFGRRPAAGPPVDPVDPGDPVAEPVLGSAAEPLGREDDAPLG
jgi:hypothetical protein